METIQERLRALREEMRKNKVSALIVPTSDFHDTEYVCDYFGARKYLSGFTGSAGTLVVGLDSAALWTDGRYFIQAASQLENTGIELMKMGMEGVPTIPAYICSILKPGECVAFDGRTVNVGEARRYDRIFRASGLHVESNLDLISPVWQDRPALPHSKTFHYGVEHTGAEMDQKLARVRERLREEGADQIVLTKIDEIAWLYNLRASDIPSFPVALAYSIVFQDGAVLYIDATRLDDESKALFARHGVRVCDYDAIYDEVKTLQGTTWIDPSTINATLVSGIQGERFEQFSPIVKMKAVKNKVELENTREAHLKDGAACTKFMYWLKNGIQKQPMDELSAAAYLQARRKEQEGYLEDSFNTICAYGPNAAMMHYAATPQSFSALEPKGMLLVDSGGHYLEGTTDITRTYVLGPLTGEEKTWFTKALRSHIRLEMAHFLYGCSGLNLDILARGPLWNEDMDYQCGTGHGVGHLLSVHEAPNGFRWRIVPERNDSAVLEEGMIQSNEPGVYEEGKFGIRHENEMVVRKGAKNKYGQFMEFENLTFVPFDRDGIDPSLMMDDEIAWLNAYHRQVYDKIAPRLNEEEAAWLQEATKPISK
ncbi:aminopeptidase P family protein [uncultured Dubosiella sp.]|uniref:aminopeptidase P family protein n=1 Tax=uncultured Dubosiella sp. TaxID=1937011 RepID=UPI002731E12D|nr:aminopeptidase P family protein [uncultured Dubosiella sp.]